MKVTPGLLLTLAVRNKRWPKDHSIKKKKNPALDVFSATFANMYFVVYWLRAFCLEAPGWRLSGLSGCGRLFTEGDLLAREKRGGGVEYFTATSLLLPSMCMLAKTKSNQEPFLSAEKQAARPASLQGAVTAFTLIMALLCFCAPH